MRPGRHQSVHDAPGAPERATGFEPVTSSLGSWHSTPELRPQTLPVARTVTSRHRHPALRQSDILFRSNDLTYKCNLHAQPGNGKPGGDQPRLYRQATTPGWSTFNLNS